MEAPDELSVAEIVQLNGFMWAFFDHISTNQVLWELGILGDPFVSTEELIQSNAYVFFGNEFSQAWIAENRHNLLGSNRFPPDRRYDLLPGDPDEMVRKGEYWTNLSGPLQFDQSAFQ